MEERGIELEKKSHNRAISPQSGVNDQIEKEIITKAKARQKGTENKFSF
jgi:hypothetical protein